MTLSLDLIADPLSAEAAWSLRVRRVGGFIQAAFAGFWLVRGSLVLHGPASAVVPVLAGLVLVGAVRYGITATAGIASRPTGLEARSSKQLSPSPQSSSSSPPSPPRPWLIAAGSPTGRFQPSQSVSDPCCSGWTTESPSRATDPSAGPSSPARCSSWQRCRAPNSSLQQVSVLECC